MAGTYIPTNATKAGRDEEWEKAKQNSAPAVAYTDREMADRYGSAGLNSFSHKGTVSQDGTVTGGTARRPVAAGTSGADEEFLSDGSYAAIQQLKARYEQQKAAGDRDAAAATHQEAERIRARAGYSGGGDGSHYIPVKNKVTGSGAVAVQEPEKDPAAAMREALDAWQKAAVEQNDGRVDYAVQQAVTELERALADAQPQFKSQAEAIDREYRQAMDNSALYAQARGDQGGIGQSQYNEIQAAKAKNHLQVQQAQTKLSTDTARQIQDLRSQGEFEKADAALEVAQNYLQQLMGLEQWAAEYDLSVDQFRESVRQWEAEFNLVMEQFRVDTDLAYGSATGRLPSTGELTLQGKNQMAGMAEALLGAGIMPSAEQLSALGLTQEQAQALMMGAQLSTAAGPGGSPTAEVPKLTPTASYEDLFMAATNSGSPYNWMKEHAGEYGFTANSALEKDYKAWLEKTPGAEVVSQYRGDKDRAWEDAQNAMESARVDKTTRQEMMTRRVWEEARRQYLQTGYGVSSVAAYETYEQYAAAYAAAYAG